MLFVLQNVTDGNVFYLTDKQQYLIGRKDCDFLIQNDQSISRKHAIIRIKEGNKITVEDCGSKYSTSYKGEKLAANMETELLVGENVHFGVCNSLYSLQAYEFITTGTLLNSDAKKQLTSDLATLNGKYVDQWSTECTHLTVEEITLTIKFLHALIEEKPIVKPAYWSKFVERIKKNLPPPNIELYNKPPVAEALLNKIDLKPNPERKTLFKGKLFVFPKEKDKKKMEDIIKKTGGTSISWEKNPLPLEDIKSSPKEFLIIQTTETIDDFNLNTVIAEFSKQGKRTIPLQEIAMSIVQCSCKKDCNPSFNRIEQVFKASGPAEPSQSNALAQNTESQYFNITKQYKIENEGPSVIPDTLEEKLEEEAPLKVSVSSNKVLTEKEVFNSQSVKRSNNDQLQGTPWKKTKVSSANLADVVKEEKKDHFLSKITSSKRRNEEGDTPDKAEESESKPKANAFDFLTRGKRNKLEPSSSGKSHPFKVIKRENDSIREVNKENPFSSSIGKNKKRSNEDDALQQSNQKKQKNESVRNVFSSTQNENSLPSVSGLSRISRINRDKTYTIWKSKKSVETDDVKSENFESYFDQEMKKFAEQFKDTVVIEIMDEIPLKPRPLRDHLDGISNVSSGRVNFKIFKKVMPLRPQSTIIGRNSFNSVAPGDTTGISDNRRDFHSDDEAETTVKTKKKVPKKFLI